MRVTPLDIIKKEFTPSKRGVDEIEVKGFLGTGTNNAAEYSAIGLTLVALGRFLDDSDDPASDATVHVFSDSLLAMHVKDPFMFKL